MARERDIGLVDEERPEEVEDDEELEMAESERLGSAVAFVSGLLLGAVLGASVALLAAPERGSVTRRRIAARLRDLQDDARDQMEDWRDEAGEELRRQRRRVKRRLKGRDR
ncbi:MAG: YtxH domain-containing protein [Gemmatimonadales bacterium]